MFSSTIYLTALFGLAQAFPPTTTTTTITIPPTYAPVIVTATVSGPPSFVTNTFYATGCDLNPTVTKTITGGVGTTSTITTTTTICTTSTILATSTPGCGTPDTSCSNSGLQWARWFAPKDTSTSCNTFGALGCNPYEPAQYKNQSTTLNGTIGEIGGFSTNGVTKAMPVYGYSMQSTYLVLDHRGYFFAPQSGTYTFRFPMCDDQCWLWIGDKAVSGWSAANADDHVVWSDLTKGTFSTSLNANAYYGLRAFWWQSGSYANLTFTVTGPGGDLLAATGQGDSPYFVQKSCDGTAKAYPAWGSET